MAMSVLLAAACAGRGFENAPTASGGASPDGSEAGTSSMNGGGPGSGGTTGLSGTPSRSSGGRIGAGGTGGNVVGSNGGTVGRGGAGAGTGGNIASGGAGASSVDASIPDAAPASCSSAADCPPPGTVCQKAACLGNQCGFVADPSATPPGNKPGDCRQVVCSDNGTETILVDPTDSNDGNECTVDSCQGNVASHTPSVGSHCQSGTKYCDANGACVDCLSDSQCPGDGTECNTEKCVQGTCRKPAAGTLCNGGQDQCDGAGTCVDCVDDAGCGGCCFCLSGICVQG